MGADIDVDKLSVRIMKSGLGAGGEVGEPSPHTNDHVGFARDVSRGGIPCNPEATQEKVLSLADGTSTGKGLHRWYAERFDECLEFIPRFGVVYASARDNHGPLGALQ